jgi:intein/homing endonuclease
MSYVLGFMYADVHIGDYKYFRGKYIVFTNTDKDRLELIKKLLSSKHKITTRKIVAGSKPLHVLRIGSKILFDRLVTLEVTPRKSLTILFPLLPVAYFNSFLLGYFDGDGCVHLELGKNGQAKRLLVIFTSGSKDFLISLSDLLLGYGLSQRRIYAHGSTLGTYQLRYSTRDSLRIFLCMYATNKLQDLGLKRKYAIFNKYLELRNLTKESIPLILNRKGPVVNREHIGLQNRHERVRLPPGPPNINPMVSFLEAAKIRRGGETGIHATLKTL